MGSMLFCVSSSLACGPRKPKWSAISRGIQSRSCASPSRVNTGFLQLQIKTRAVCSFFSTLVVICARSNQFQLFRCQMEASLHNALQGIVAAEATVGEDLQRPRTTRFYLHVARVVGHLPSPSSRPPITPPPSAPRPMSAKQHSLIFEDRYSLSVSSILVRRTEKLEFFVNMRGH